MRNLYVSVVLSSILVYVALCQLIPFQERALERKYLEYQKTEWQRAEEQCKKTVESSFTASQDSQGLTYCISTAGRLLATIPKNQR